MFLSSSKEPTIRLQALRARKASGWFSLSSLYLDKLQGRICSKWLTLVQTNLARHVICHIVRSDKPKWDIGRKLLLYRESFWDILTNLFFWPNGILKIRARRLIFTYVYKLPISYYGFSNFKTFFSHNFCILVRLFCATSAHILTRRLRLHSRQSTWPEKRPENVLLGLLYQFGTSHG